MIERSSIMVSMYENTEPAVEKMDAELWHAWIADTRPDGLGISKALKYDEEMRLFLTDTGDTHRTNLLTPGQIAGDATFRIEKFGVFVSFSDAKLYADFFSSVLFRFYLGDKPVFILSASTVAAPEGWPKDKNGAPKESFPHGYMSWTKLEKSIGIPPRMSFYATMTSTPGFTEKMRRIETGCKVASFAIIKFFLAGQKTRHLY
jgi:hypothetical protein